MSKKDKFTRAYLSPAEVSKLTGLSIKTLERMRAKGIGPPFYKIGRLVRYGLDDLYTWMERGRRSNGDDEREEQGQP